VNNPPFHDLTPRTPRTIRPDRGDAGHRLDQVLLRHLSDRPDASRTRVQAWIRSGDVTVGTRPVTRVAARVPGGAVIEVALPALAPRGPHRPEAVPLAVLYEDEHLLAIDKPAGMVVHPSLGHASGTLVNALLAYASSWPAGTRPTLVHRLDKLTSGVLLVSKSEIAHARLMSAMSARAIDKDYLAIVSGCVRRARGEIALPVQRDPADRRRMLASVRSGRPSVTRYLRLARSTGRRAGLSVLQCRLVTGRMHQIRVHLQAAGWPLLGDPVYGPPRALRFDAVGLNEVVRRLSRQALHSWRVALAHPISGAQLQIVAPVPGDLAAVLAAAGVSDRLSPLGIAL
jgi:23S rRNA pseudouridine1911/1915/1917 synthase